MLKQHEEKIVNQNIAAIDAYRSNRTTLGVAQFDKTTGKQLATFKNRYQAAAWIIANDLTTYKYRGIGQTRCCIAGALTVALRKTPYAYGFMWKYINDPQPQNLINTKRLPTGLTVDPSTLVSIYDSNGVRKDFKSIKEACMANGIHNRMRSETLQSYCKKNGLMVHIREKTKLTKDGKKYIIRSH